jgi:hypothetical protein
VLVDADDATALGSDGGALHTVAAVKLRGRRVNWRPFKIKCPRPDVDLGYASAFTHDLMID